MPENKVQYVSKSSALEVSRRCAIYKSTFYLLTYGYIVMKLCTKIVSDWKILG